MTGFLSVLEPSVQVPHLREFVDEAARTSVRWRCAQMASQFGARAHGGYRAITPKSGRPCSLVESSASRPDAISVTECHPY